MSLSAATHLRITSWAAFLIPALALWLPSGYAWGTALLMLGAVLGAPHWIKPAQPLPRAAWWLLAAIGLMALVWLLGSDWSKGARVLNKPLRYVAMLPCLLYALRFPPRLGWLLAGIALGAAGGGLRAIHDVYWLGLERPWITPQQTGNAIQLGNLCGLFGLMCWLQLMVYWQRWAWPQRLAVTLCCALGLLGSLLSQTRGGWLALMLCTPVLLWLLARWVSRRRALGGALVLCVLLLPMGWHGWPQLEKRLDWAIEEVTNYRYSGQADTSVGHRLDHWQLALAMGRDRPWTGWGEQGYVTEKARRVAAGEASPVVMEFGHTHNEALDMLAKRGLVGLGGLLLIYSVPLVVFWPRRRTGPVDGGRDDEMVLRLIGVSVPLAYMGFGLTQVFFAHYNGVVLYLDMLILVYASLQAKQGQDSDRAVKSCP